MLNNNNYRDGRWSGRAQGVEVSPEPRPGAFCALSPALACEAEPGCGVPRREQVGSQPPASVSLSQKRALRRPRPGQGRYGNAGPQQSHPAVPAPSCRDRALRCQAWGRARTLGRCGEGVFGPVEVESQLVHPSETEGLWASPGDPISAEYVPRCVPEVPAPHPLPSGVPQSKYNARNRQERVKGSSAKMRRLSSKIWR